MNYLKLLKTTLSLILMANLSFGAGMDSLRLEKRGAQQFVIHRVGQGETLYAISRRYQSSVEEISRANNLTGNAVSIGQEIAIPWAGGSNASNSGASAVSGIVHTVEAGQTLYAISRQYDVSVDEIKKLNNLTSNELSTGQKLAIRQGTTSGGVVPVATGGANTVARSRATLHTVEPSETLFSIARRYNVSVDDIKKWNDLKGNSLSVGQQLNVGENAGESPAPVVVEAPPREKKKELVVKENGSLKQINKDGYTRDTASVAGYEKVVEEGFAMVIENSPETRKFLALHRTAPIGAILEVKNRMNGRSIYVRVVGKLPDTGINNKVLIRLSEKAYQRLEAIDPKVPVEVSYVP